MTADRAQRQSCHRRLARRRVVQILILSALAIAAAPGSALGQDQDHDLARTPPMGWNTWNHFGCNIDEALIRDMADAMVSTGMRDAGYEYVIIDDCWQIARGADGTIVADPARFPGGIEALADYVQKRGLKLGIYTDAGLYTCQGRPGSYGYEQQDANTYAAWGIDYVKIDWCYTEGLDPRSQYALWRDVLRAVDRPMVFSICNWGVDAPWSWGPSTGHLWRTTYDIEDRWERILEIADLTVHLAAYAGPGGWNDPDMLEVGNGGMTHAEYRAHMSLWAIMAAPLIAGNDLRVMSPATRDLLTNQEVIAIDQDRAGIQGTRVHDAGHQEVWVKPLAETGTRAVVLLNRAQVAADVAVNWQQIGLAAGAASVRDLWTQADLGTMVDGYVASVPPHSATMLLVSGAEPPPPALGTWYLSELPWAYALNGLGPVERDATNGGQEAGDGMAITLDGVLYAKGLGTHAASRIRYHLGGRCRRLHSWVGLDDQAGDRGSVTFQVWADGFQLYDSGVVTPTAPARQLTVDVAGRHELTLVVTDAGDSNVSDLADWADARLVCLAPATTIYLPVTWLGK